MDPYVLDFMAHKSVDNTVCVTTAKDDTKNVFISWERFAKQINLASGVIDATHSGTNPHESHLEEICNYIHGVFQ